MLNPSEFLVLLEKGFVLINKRFPFKFVPEVYLSFFPASFGKNIEVPGIDPKLVPLYQLNRLYASWLYGKNTHYVSYKFGGKTYTVVPGHFYGLNEYGPDLCSYSSHYNGLRDFIMIVGSAPSWDEIHSGRNFTGDFGQTMFKVLQEEGFANSEVLYLTNRNRIYTKNRTEYLFTARLFAPLLENELFILQPKAIICLGADASTYLNKQTLQSLIDHPTKRTISFPIGKETVSFDTILFGAPLRALHEYNDYLQFRRAINTFVRWNKTGSLDKPCDSVTYEVINSSQRLSVLIDEILSKARSSSSKLPVAIDLEWEGRVPGLADSFVRCVSLAITPNHAYIIEVCDTEGKFLFDDPIALRDQLKRLFARGNNICIYGYSFFSDLPWLNTVSDFGDKFYISDSLDIEEDEVFDGIFAYHALDECGVFDLESTAKLFLGVDPWSAEVETFLSEYCKTRGIPRKALTGYGPIPPSILYPYAAKDVAYTFALCELFKQQLHRDRYGNDCRGPYKRSMRACPGFVEMYLTGINIDIERIFQLMKSYSDKLQVLVNEIRAEINWPDFNYRSHRQCAELLFGENYTDKKARTRPETAISLYLKPVKATDGRPWDSSLESSNISPSVDLETLESLTDCHPVVNKLRDVRILDQALKTVLRPPGNDGELEGGLLMFLCSDGKIHPRYSHLRETRRCSSKDPPLQNWAGDREEDYRRILGDEYKFPIRSILYAPEGYRLIEVDYTAAELLMFGVVARDRQLIEDYYRAALPDNHPDKLDIHSNIAVLAFNLNCPPTKSALAAMNKLSLRHAAKRIIFGLNYGRGAQSCYQQLRLAGVDVKYEDVEKLIETIYNRYSKIPECQDQIRRRVKDPGWLANVFGSYRRFGTSRQKDIVAHMEREALSFVCQSGVADAMEIAMWNFTSYPARKGYKLIMHNHDALVFLVEESSVDEFVNKVVPYCMQEKVTFKSCDLSGRPYPDSDVFRFCFEVKSFKHWGE